MGRAPVELLTGDVPSWGYCLSLLPLSHSRSLSISHLSDLHQRAATVSQGEGGRGEEEEDLLILDAIYLYSSHTPVVCRALLGFPWL